ncbi:MAG: carotenoid 1,2-hydratase [Acidobacteria bacterium]|nr:carotenoid 1,2-hydratase [Acidobacteriota bacterium]
MTSRRAVVVALATGLALAAVLAPTASDRTEPAVSRLELGPGLDPAAFARATAVQEYHLPADHGPHLEFQTEWWYYTGNLTASDGRRFGFQLTFFRRGLAPGEPSDGLGLTTHQVYFAHLAITDVAARSHVFAERWSRGAGGLAGARGTPFAVWLEGWRVESRRADGSAVRLVARDGPLLLDLELEARKPLVRHGEQGLSPKSDEPGNASHYIGYTRLSARGRLAASSGAEPVSGDAWFDHEWSTSALGAGAVGWDWFSLQLQDGRELMYFQIRREDGGVEAVSGGTLVDAAGDTRRLPADAVSLTVLDRWTSPQTGATYPSRWRLRVPGEDLDLLVAPWIPAQEMRTSFVYWEGAVRVSGTRAGRPLEGHGYVELTGYARSMQGVF